MENKPEHANEFLETHKTYIVESKEVDPEAGIFEAMVSTEAVDRDSDILVAEGAELENYLRNPVVLFGHNYHDPEAIVARTVEVAKIPGKGIKLTFQFLERGLSKSADLVRDLWGAGFLNAMSVGFIPKEWERRKDDNGEELARGLVYKAWEFLEGSIVTIPANQDALRLAVKVAEFGVTQGMTQAEHEKFLNTVMNLYAQFKDDTGGEVAPDESQAKAADEPDPNNDDQDETPQETEPELTEDLLDVLSVFVETITEVYQDD